MVEVVTQKVSLSVTDGSAMEAFVAQPSGNEQRPGLMLFQEAFGVNFHIREVAERFAREGITVIAPELFHRTAPPGIEIPYDKFSEAQPHMKALTPDALKSDIRAAYDWLRAQRNVFPRSDRMRGILHGRARFISGERFSPDSRRGFFLRGRNFAGITERSAQPKSDDAVFLGRPR